MLKILSFPRPSAKDLSFPRPPAKDLPFLRPPTKDLESEKFEFESEERHIPSQQEWDDLFRDIELTKSDVELLTSGIMEWNLSDNSCRTTDARKRHESFWKYISEKR